MNIDSGIIFSIFKKDLRGLLPLVCLTAGLFVIDALLAGMKPGEMNPMLFLLQSYMPWLCLFAAALLIVAVFQLDPAVSLSHDWLTRPISATNLFLAKLLFLLLAIFVPMACARFAVNLYNGYALVESFLEATFIERTWVLLVIPVLVTASILSGSLLQCIGILLGLLLLVSIPAATMPGFVPNPDGLGSEVTLASILWIIGNLFALLVFTILVVVYYLQYRHRKNRQAWIAFSLLIFSPILVVASLMRAPIWETAFSIQQSVVASPAASVQDSLSLDPVSACFPASIIDPNKTSMQPVGVEHWPDFQIARAGIGALSFVTTVRGRGLPEGWRVFPLKATATYSADSLSAAAKFLPSGSAYANPITPHNNGSSHFWLLPAEITQQLADEPSVHLQLDYSLGLLSPTSVKIEMDNVRRYYPKLGFCSAELNTVQNQVDVECFKRGIQPALISAELMDIPASRVDSSRPNYSPAWSQIFSGKHYELTVRSPTLADSSKIILTAYEARGFFNKQVSSPGLIGDSNSVCPISVEYQSAQASWSDKSPHETSFIAVDSDVRLEVLDWGGSGTALILLPGGGATAHAYDELAQRLTPNHRVIGITRRGFGASSKPDYGYDIARLSQDILEVLDALQIESSILVGHSLAGHELSLLGAQHPDRFTGLIYLDAAYDNSSTNKEDAPLLQALPPAPGATPSDLVSYAAITQYLGRVGGMIIPEGEIMASIDFATGTRLSDPRIADAIMAGLEKPEYEKIRLPALAVYAIEQDSPEDYMKPWYDRNDPRIQAIIKELFRIRNGFQLEHIELFKQTMEFSDVVVLNDSDHWVFVANENEVLQAITNFIEENKL